MSAMSTSGSLDIGPNFTTLRSGLLIDPSQNRAIDRILAEILEAIPARFALLCDVSGQIISARGDRTGVEPVTLGSLVAGDLAASQEIARMLGEYQAYQITLREGKTSHTFIAEAGPYLVLLVQVPADVPLGWARMVLLRSARQLASVVAIHPDATLGPADAVQEEREASPNPLSDDNLPEMFGDALDELWTH